MNLSLNTLLIGVALMVVQLLAALPWMAVSLLSRADLQAILRRGPFPDGSSSPSASRWAFASWRALLFLSFVQDQGSLEVFGRAYAAVLQLQITMDLFILVIALVLWVWPKGGAITLAAFREGVRQWLFWLLTLLAGLLMVISIFVPYFTFGEDYLMVKQLGYDTIMLAAVLFGALAASLSISEEIEGRTAITVMSKPVSRRQFMLGKYLGIMLACLFMFGMLGAFFEGVLLVKHWWEKLEPLTQQTAVESLTTQERIGVVPTPGWVIQTLQQWALPSQITDVLRGIGQWLAHSADTLPGLVLCFSQVMVLVALAVALATRLPMVVNLSMVLVVYFLAHLTPVLMAVAGKARMTQAGPVPRLLGFVAQVFDTVLPDLGSFRMNPSLLSDAPPPPLLFSRVRRRGFALRRGLHGHRPAVRTDPVRGSRPGLRGDAEPLTPRPPLPPRGEGEKDLWLPLSPRWERGLGGEGGFFPTSETGKRHEPARRNVCDWQRSRRRQGRGRWCSTEARTSICTPPNRRCRPACGLSSKAVRLCFKAGRHGRPSPADGL